MKYFFTIHVLPDKMQGGGHHQGQQKGDRAKKDVPAGRPDGTQHVIKISSDSRRAFYPVDIKNLNTVFGLSLNNSQSDVIAESQAAKRDNQDPPGLPLKGSDGDYANADTDSPSFCSTSESPLISRSFWGRVSLRTAASIFSASERVPTSARNTSVSGPLPRRLRADFDDSLRCS